MSDRMIDDLTRDLPRGEPPVAALLAAGRASRGRRNRRQRLAGGTALVATAAAVVATLVLPGVVGGDRPAPTDPPGVARPGRAVPFAVERAAGDGGDALPSWRLAAKPSVATAPGASTAEALTSLLIGAEPPEADSPGLGFGGLLRGPPRGTDGQGAKRAPSTRIRSVVREDGVVRVDLTDDVMDPLPNAGPMGPPGRLQVQQLIWTVQGLLGTNDPVELTVGDRRAGVRGFRTKGPSVAEPGVLLGVDEGVAGPVRVENHRVVPGDTLTLTYDESLGRVPSWHLVPVGGRVDLDAPAHRLSRVRDRPTDAGRGPDRLLVPADVDPGAWLLCRDVTPDRPTDTGECVALQVADPATAPPAEVDPSQAEGPSDDAFSPRVALVGPAEGASSLVADYTGSLCPPVITDIEGLDRGRVLVRIENAGPSPQACRLAAVRYRDTLPLGSADVATLDGAETAVVAREDGSLTEVPLERIDRAPAPIGVLMAEDALAR